MHLKENSIFGFFYILYDFLTFNDLLMILGNFDFRIFIILCDFMILHDILLILRDFSRYCSVDLVLLHGFPWISMDLITKTAEKRATRHEVKNFLYQAIDLFKPRRLEYTREPETPK